jgi:hypothetical protein
MAAAGDLESCSTPTCRTGPPSKPIAPTTVTGARGRIDRPGHRQPDRHRRPRTSTRHRGKPIIDVPAEPHPGDGGRPELRRRARRPVGTSRGARRRAGRRARGHLRRRTQPGPVGQPHPHRFGSHATRRPPAPPNHRTATAAPRAGGSRNAPTDWRRSAEGRVDTRGNSGNNWVSPDVPDSSLSRRANSPAQRPCRHRQLPAAANRHRRTPSIRGAHRRPPLWPPNPGVPRHTPSPRRSPNRRQRSRRRGDTAARRTPAGSRLPSCWRGFMPPRREAAVAGVARSELGS